MQVTLCYYGFNESQSVEKLWYEDNSQPALTYSKLTVETLEQGIKYVHC